MQGFYRQAERVVVWLGESDDDSEKAIEFLLGVAQQPESRGRHGTPLSGKLDAGHLFPITRLLDSPWLERVWVLQEIAVAQDVQLVKGRHSFSWQVLTKCYDEFAAAGNETLPLALLNDYHSLGIKTARLWREIQQGTSTWRQFSLAPLPDRLATMLLLSNGLMATKCQDHLYALLGMVASPSETQDEPAIKPDYNLAPAQVLRRLAVYCISPRDEEKSRHSPEG